MTYGWDGAAFDAWLTTPPWEHDEYYPERSHCICGAFLKETPESEQWGDDKHECDGKVYGDGYTQCDQFGKEHEPHTVIECAWVTRTHICTKCGYVNKFTEVM